MESDSVVLLHNLANKRADIYEKLYDLNVLNVVHLNLIFCWVNKTGYYACLEKLVVSVCLCFLNVTEFFLQFSENL